jgi:hypothetical protein
MVLLRRICPLMTQSGHGAAALNEPIYFIFMMCVRNTNAEIIEQKVSS